MGSRGRVLWTWWVGGIRYTSLEAIAEFIGQPTVALPQLGQSIPPPTDPAATAGIPATTPARAVRSSTRRDRIEEDLKRFGL